MEDIYMNVAMLKYRYGSYSWKFQKGMNFTLKKVQCIKYYEKRYNSKNNYSQKSYIQMKILFNIKRNIFQTIRPIHF